MLSQLLKQIDNHLANKPFQRHGWGKLWHVYITLQPPLSQEAPLWKRSKAELRLLRLFDRSPEELAQKIERYWQKPRWRRWFSYWGMKKKLDVWNYYQRCLAYQAVRLQTPEIKNLSAGKCRLLLSELGFALYQCTVK